MRRTRTITIGEMRSGWYVRYLQWGVPDGFYVHWKGRKHPFDPCEFFTWWQVVRAIDGRLSEAGLRRVGEVMEFALGVPDYWQRLRVTVERAKA